jgi:Ankyrin repeats (many copies)
MSDPAMESRLAQARREATESARQIAVAVQDPLIRAVADGNALAVCSLLDEDADPNVVEAVGFAVQLTPLHVAAMAGRLEVCAILLDSGADPTRALGDGATARDVAVNTGWFAVAGFLEMLPVMRRKALSMNPGHSYLELAYPFREREGKGEPCSQCGVPVPDEFRFDHVSSHLWQIRVSRGESGPREPARSATEERVIADFKIWNYGRLRLTDRAIYLVSNEPLAFFPDQTGTSVPWPEVQSTGYAIRADPTSLLPWAKVHHVIVRGHHGLGGLDIACNSERQASEIRAAIDSEIDRCHT